MDLYLTYLGVAIIFNLISYATTGEPFMISIN